MTHLTDAEYVDLIEGALPAARAAHVDRCDACRRQIEALRAALLETTIDDVPEPSPLFWTHLSQNVRDVVAGECSAPRHWLDWHSVRLWPAVAVLAALVVAAALWRAIPAPARRGLDPIPATGNAVASSTPHGGDPLLEDDIDADEAWALVRSVADEVPWQQAHDAGISARPGSADRMALELSAAERRELARLLQDELRRSGA